MKLPWVEPGCVIRGSTGSGSLICGLISLQCWLAARISFVIDGIRFRMPVFDLFIQPTCMPLAVQHICTHVWVFTASSWQVVEVKFNVMS
jgi:hypothetical protein